MVRRLMVRSRSILAGWLVVLACPWLSLRAEEQAPAPAAEAFAFVQMCDTQLGIGGYEHDKMSFELAVKQINRLHPEFVVICGDLVNQAGDGQAWIDFNQI